MAGYDDLNNKRIFSVAILSVIVVAVTALAVQVLYYWMVRLQEDQTAAMSNYGRSDRVIEQQTAEISGYGVDPDTGNLTMPIDAAIKKVVDRQPEKDESPPADDEA